MTSLIELDEMPRNEKPFYTVVHPLDDAPEEKVDTEHLGPMPMTTSVRVCLYALRGYLFLMFGLLAFRVLARRRNSRVISSRGHINKKGGEENADENLQGTALRSALGR